MIRPHIGSFKGIDPETGRVIQGEVPPAMQPVKPARSGLAKYWEFVRVVTGPEVTEQVFNERLARCLQCLHLHRQGGGLYCRQCGCGAWRAAELRTKLWFAKLECPRTPAAWLPVDGGDVDKIGATTDHKKTVWRAAMGRLLGV